MKFTEKIKKYENELNQTDLTHSEITAKIEEFIGELIKGGENSTVKCSDVFTEDERKHLEESLHADLDGYWEEVKDMFKKDPERSSAQEQVDNILQKDFIEWQKLSNDIFKKCKLNKWEIPSNG